MSNLVTTRDIWVREMAKARSNNKRIVERSFVMDDIMYQSYMDTKGNHIGHIEFDLRSNDYARYVIHMPDPVNYGEDRGRRTFH